MASQQPDLRVPCAVMVQTGSSWAPRVKVVDQQSCGEGPPELRACYSHPCGNHVAHGVELMMTVRFGKSEIHIFSCIILLQIHQKGGRLSKEDREYRL